MYAVPMAQIICESAELPKIAAQHIALALTKAIETRGSASFVLAGGTTPRATYEALALIPGIAWPHVSVYFGDERAVPPDHPDSNYRSAREALLDRVGLSATQVHRMPADGADPDAAARAYAAEL